MKILVTGGLGFIGSNLCERLVKEGHEITIIDNLHTGTEENVKDIRSNVRVVIGRAKQLVEIGEKFDLIFHEGIYSSTPMYKEKPSRVAEVVEDFIAILEYAKANKTKIVYASSSSVYNGIAPPQREDAPIGVTDFYTEGRVAMERLAELYHKLYGMQIIGLRYFSVYGPHEENKKSYANLISQFMWAIRKGEQPIVYGDGSQKRDFTYVDDIVEANMLAMKSAIGLGVFNAGTGKAIAINEMIELLNRKMGTNLKPKYIPNPISNYVHYTLADTKKAEKELGFKAKVSLEEGIAKLV
ncbi:MAG: NAD-dependent epimerase/dehydratase family protein [Candidatus Micrarchaeia archaeon]